MPLIEQCRDLVGGRAGISFPNTHPLDLTGNEVDLFREADLVLNLSVSDASPLITKYDDTRQRTGPAATLNLAPGCRYIDISLRHFRWGSWRQDYGMLLPTDLAISADVTLAVPALLTACREILSEGHDQHRIRNRFNMLKQKHDEMRQRWSDEANAARDQLPIAPSFLAKELGEVVKNDDWVLTNGNLDGWARRLWNWDRPYRFVGGAGLGYGAGVSIGAALAHKSARRLVVGVQGDGDMLYTASALWTAAHHRIPVLIIIYNNRSYFNDEKHQESMAVARGRPRENKTVGIRMDDPPVDFAALARSLGVLGIGPVERPSELRPALEKAVQRVKDQQRPALVDVVCRRRD